MATGCANPDDALYSVAQLRAVEHAALGALPPQTLMQRAGEATAAQALALLADADPHAPVLVLAGPGNNGGDALEAAALLAAQGRRPQVRMLADPARLPPDAQAALARARAQGVSFIGADSLPRDCMLVIDGLFGIGLTRPPAGPYRDAIDTVNAMDCPVLSIDLPSGLDADSGNPVGSGSAIRADITLTFIGNKPGLHTAHGRDHAGRVMVERVGIAADLFPPPLALLNSTALFSRAFHARPHASHKGSFGDLTLIGGAAGMGGALMLAARMGAMAGAGRVYAAFAGPVPAYDALHPELMCRAAREIELRNGAIVIGPGLGQSQEAAELLALALDRALPLVIDADALNLIAAEPDLAARLAARETPALLTPHPLEAARLLGSDAGQIQADRLAAAKDIARRLRSVVVLKGSGSVIATPDERCVVNPTGNPALATAGSGDVLAGLCGALMANGLPADEAALAAVWLHGAAADDLVAEGVGPVGLTASELAPAIRRRLNRR